MSVCNLLLGGDSAQNNSCTRKHRHETKLDAIVEAERLASRIGRRFDTYHCIWCDGWHVGRS